MTRRRPVIDTSRRQLLIFRAIPVDLMGLGWWIESRECAPRHDTALNVTAVARVDLRSDEAGHLFAIWTGASYIPRRKLRDTYATAPEVMRAVEAAEAEGPHSAAWEGQSGPPQRAGWQHLVRSKRDAWGCLTPDGRHLIVLQLPAPRDRCGGLLYTVWIEGVHVGRDGVPRQFGDPIEGMIEAEYEAGLDGATISARSLVTAV